MKKLLIVLTFVMSMASAYASRPQIIMLPDGRQMVCYYYPTTNYTDCSYL